MKKLFVITLTALALALNANAGDYKYLVLETQSGGEKVLVASGLTLTFSGGNLVASDGTTVSLSDMSKMYFAETSGISDVNAAKDAPVSVYTADGRSVATFENVAQARATLGKGLYVMKQNGRIYKYVQR